MSRMAWVWVRTWPALPARKERVAAGQEIPGRMRPTERQIQEAAAVVHSRRLLSVRAVAVVVVVRVLNRHTTPLILLRLFPLG
jgi:hypothetical protein